MPYKNLKSPKARAAHARAKRRWREKLATARPFVGVDGEGAGEDAEGRQIYQLLRAGDDEIRAPKGLKTETCLAFLADLPPGPIYVGYFFDYDATQILRDLPPERREQLFDRGERSFHYVAWRGFEIDYLPRKYLRVRREGSKRWTTINDVGSFFQCRFTAALENWNIGTKEERAIIEAGKLRRGGAKLTAKDDEYNALECRFLADLMDAFRSVCADLDLVPRLWQGPGNLAKSMLARNAVPKRSEYDGQIPDRVLQLAQAAYYGGRFERRYVGEVKGPVYSYDINSAYPAAMLQLPCLVHGEWKRGKGRPGDLFLADVSFTHPKGLALCDLPVRLDTGTITWPREGRGVYWSTELDASRASYRVHAAWHYVKRCDCKPFAWVPAVYQERKMLGKSTKGYPLKLGLNSIYGQCAQSVGTKPYANPVWAGHITAITRASIIRAYEGHRDSVVMIATDGVFTTEPLTVQVGPGLGEWEEKQHGDLFVVQPGVYFGAEKPRTRGIARRALEKAEPAIRKAWKAWRGRGEFPSVPVKVQLFTGLKLATARGKPESAGRWVRGEKRLSFNPEPKRVWRGKGKALGVPKGGQKSVPYTREIGLSAEMARLEMEAMPDYET